MSEYINNISKRKETLKNVLRQLHEGRSVDEVKAEFSQLLQEVGSSEIAEVEQMLIADGIPVEEIQNLCDVHVAVFQESLNQQPSPETVPGHPVFTFQAENRLLETTLEHLKDFLDQYIQNGDEHYFLALRSISADLQTFNCHYLRKEHLLFPILEKLGFEGPSKVMWGVHDQIRAQIKRFFTLLNVEPAPLPENLAEEFTALSTSMIDMIYKEEHILFPAALEKLTEKDWGIIHSQESEFGYFKVKPQEVWQANSQPERKRYIPEDENLYTSGELPLNTGALTLQQIDLMLNHLPVDVTFVDENDEVRYFSRGYERIFSRSTAIIGRKVQNCHPPQSLARVQRIVDDFRSGKRNTAEFWIQMQGKFIHIRYFAIRDEHNIFRGTLEVSQDVTSIRALEGERRLLDD